MCLTSGSCSLPVAAAHQIGIQVNIVTVSAESVPPPQPLVAAALRRYDQSSDVRWAVPALAGAPRERASQLLPAAAATCAAGALPCSRRRSCSGAIVSAQAAAVH
jgi:hypothetical protein